MFISGSIFADNALENFSLKAAKESGCWFLWLGRCCCCLPYHLFFLLDDIIYLTIFFVLMLYLDAGGTANIEKICMLSFFLVYGYKHTQYKA